MPLALGCLQAVAQMVPIQDLPPEETTRSIYSTSVNPGPTPAYTRSASPIPGEGAGVHLPPPPKGHQLPRIGPFSTAALGLTAGTLGPGVELALPVLRNVNVRFGGSYFDLRYPFTIDGVNYNTALKLTSGQGMIDWFPKRGGFHISAGALYCKDEVSAAAEVAPGQQFKLGDTAYLNSLDDPVQGTASLKFQKKVAPIVLLGFGNLIPRSGRHISVPFEFGGAYLAPPNVAIQLAGTACTTQGCFNIAKDPAVQANLAKEESKLNRDIRPLQIYPILSLGFALRF